MRASKPAPAITANPSPLIRPTSSRRRCAADARSRRPPSRSFGMPRFVASRLAVPAGMIASVRLRAREHVDAALHHAVAAPHDDELGTAVERPAHLLRRLLRLRHLAPVGRGDAVHRRARGAAPRARRRGSSRRGRPPRPASSRRPPRPGVAVRCGGVAGACRQSARSAARRCPSARPATTSLRWCMPRYRRDSGDDGRAARRPASTRRRSTHRRWKRDEISSASAP